MNHKVWGMCITVGFLFLFAWSVLADQQPVQDAQEVQKSLQLIMESMEKTGAVAERIQLHYGSALPMDAGLKEVQEFAEKLAFRMGLKKETNHLSTAFIFQRLHQGVRTELRVVALPGSPKPPTWNSYVTIKIEAEAKDLEAVQTQLYQVQKALKQHQMFPKFNSCVQGKYNGTLKNDVQLDKLGHLFTYLDASIVEQAQDPTVKSYSGYSSQVASFILTGGQKMNVQAGIHVDRLGGITRLTVGTPIITMEY